MASSRRGVLPAPISSCSAVMVCSKPATSKDCEHQPKQAESHFMLGETAAPMLTEMKLRKIKGEYGCVETEGVRFDTDAALVM